MTNDDLPTADGPDLRTAADAVLARLVGAPAGAARLREDQWRAIEALVADKRRALVVQRTGWGKSAVYFVATALLRERGAGPTVILSPLLALMRNQVDAAARAGIHARTINSSTTEEWDTIQHEVAAGEVDVLLVSPEGLNSPHSDSRSVRCSAGSGLAGAPDPGGRAQTVQGVACSRRPRGPASRSAGADRGWVGEEAGHRECHVTAEPAGPSGLRALSRR